MSLSNQFLKIRKILVVFWLLFLFMGIGGLFWYNEWIFSLPTPVPADYKNIKVGSYIELEDKLITKKDKPVFIHFYNPECPCSRFNIPQVKSLIKKYGNQVTFAIAVMNNEEDYSKEEIQNKFGYSLPVFFDESLAKSCGVYSTPQAVIISAEHKLYYRGNYNKSRYCTDAQSNYAQMAIDSLLNNKVKPTFNPFALKAYGCELPNCKKPE